MMHRSLAWPTAMVGVIASIAVILNAEYQALGEPGRVLAVIAAAAFIIAASMWHRERLETD